MTDNEKNLLVHVTTAPYMQKATALIGKPRKIGGNQFRHMMATMAILIDYHMTDSAMLKAAVLHDWLEDFPEANLDEIYNLDEDGPEVVNLIIEVSRTAQETKEEYLMRVVEHGSYKAKIIKLADRISNMTDISTDIFNTKFIKNYSLQTEKYILPMAQEIHYDMYLELKDLVSRKRLVVQQIYQIKRMLRNFLTM
jgi:(p)ppGpp synthase/HD superfamily hydrolase